MRTEKAYGYNKQGELTLLKYKPKPQENSQSTAVGLIGLSIFPFMGA